MKNAVLSEFRILRPRYEKSQTDSLGWLSSVHAFHEKQFGSKYSEDFASRLLKLFQRYGCGPDKIAKRGLDVEDMQMQNFESMTIYGQANKGIEGRMRLYKEIVDELMQRFYVEDTTPPNHIVHVSCTGYVSPSPAQTLINQRGWIGQTNVTNAYHMGCYAALPAIRMAKAFVRDGESSVDVVHNEICSLHMNPLNHSPEQLVVYSLFADGHIRYRVSDSESATGFEVLAVHEALVPDTLNCMTWVPADWGIQMTLAKEVPQLIGARLGEFLKELFAKAQVSTPKEEMQFAIHPGGPRIIDSIQTGLDLRDDQLSHSRLILREYGNMSSATLPHIWESMTKDDQIKNGQLIVSLAFGPGLTIFGTILRRRK